MVEFDVEYPDRKLNRLTSALRILMAIPVVILLAVVGGVTTATTGTDAPTLAASGSALLVLPPLLMIVQNRIGVYLALMDDRYPSTDERQSVRLDLPYPAVIGLAPRVDDTHAAA